MASAAQIAANRANAQKSTGPRTVEGKQRSSLAALRHGLTAQTVVLPHEDPQAYGQIRESLYNQYEPATDQECMLVDKLASSWWRTIRVRQIETDMLDLQIRTLNNTYPEKETTKTTDRQALAVRFVTESEKDFVNFMRYDAAIERAFYRALNTLDKLQAARKKQEAAASVLVTPTNHKPNRGAGASACPEIGFVSHPSDAGTEPRVSSGSASQTPSDNVIGFVSQRS